MYTTYDVSVRLSNEANKELCWWITNTISNLQHIHMPDSDIIIYTDESTLGWGVTDDQMHQEVDRKQTR